MGAGPRLLKSPGSPQVNVRDLYQAHAHEGIRKIEDREDAVRDCEVVAGVRAGVCSKPQNSRASTEEKGAPGEGLGFRVLGNELGDRHRP